MILADSVSGLIKLIASCGSKRLILEMIRGVVHNTPFVILKFEMRIKRLSCHCSCSVTFRDSRNCTSSKFQPTLLE